MDGSVASLLVFAFLANVPLGLWRVRLRRWSIPWLLACDGSVPVLWLLRRALDAPSWVIPFEIGLALLANLGVPWLLRRLRATPSGVVAG